MTEGNYFDGWRFLSMPEVCDINPTRPRNLTYSDETLTSFVPMAAVDDQQGKIVDLQTRPFGEIKRGYTYFEENDVLFAKITPCMENGKSAIARELINGFGFGSTEFHVLRPHRSILPEWIYYFVRREPFRQEAKTNFRGAVGQQRVPQEFLQNHSIPIPYPDDPDRSLAIQSRVISRIENIFRELAEASRLHEKIVADTNRLMDAALAEMLPDPENGLPERWGAIPLSALASEEPNQIIPSDHPSDTYNYWGLDAISEGQNAEPLPNYIQGSDIKSTCVSFSSKHVLYSKLRPYLNKVIVPSVNGIGSTEWVVYEPNPNLLRREYLAFVMRTKWFVNLASGSSYGARMPRANKSVLREIKIPIPFISDTVQSLSIQDQIVERITQFSYDVDNMQKGNTQQERLLAQLEQSILAQAFQGEL